MLYNFIPIFITLFYVTYYMVERKNHFPLLCYNYEYLDSESYKHFDLCNTVCNEVNVNILNSLRICLQDTQFFITFIVLSTFFCCFNTNLLSFFHPRKLYCALKWIGILQNLYSFIHLFSIHYCYKITLGQVNDYT